jgi:DNA polymerase-3 subunit alpha (Gram-positive type)
MIVFDTESTGLMRPVGLTSLDDQPHLIEIAAVKLNMVGESTYEFHTLVKPPVPIPPEITKITSITNAMVADAPTIDVALDQFAAFVLGSDAWCAHNLTHDRGLLVVELQRLDREHAFPYPPRSIDTVEWTNALGLANRKLTTLYEYLFSVKPKQTHRGLDDVRLLADCVVELTKRGVL